MSDLIDRQAAIDLLTVFTQADALGHTPRQIVEALPSAQPEVLACGTGELDAPDTNVGNMISRQAAIDALLELDASHRVSWKDAVIDLIDSLPSAQSEPCKDAISREAASEWLKQYGQDVLHGKYKFSLMYIWKNLMDLPSAQPEIIHCRECKYAEVADPEDGQDGYTCQFHRGSIWFSGSYCSWAERRTE